MKAFDRKAQLTALLFSTLMLGVSMSSHARSTGEAMQEIRINDGTSKVECRDGTIYWVSLHVNPYVLCADHNGPVGGHGNPTGSTGTGTSVGNDPVELRLGNRPIGNDATEHRLDDQSVRANSDRVRQPVAPVQD
ncbi:MAG: hypothetical protein ACQEXG_07910 [Pseudomonadota bacterium]